MERGLSDRVHALVGDFVSWPWKPGSFGLVWSEGALYNMGLANAVQMCRKILCERGYRLRCTRVVDSAENDGLC
jgi:hypothetical protein